MPPNTKAPQPKNELSWSSVSLPELWSRRRPRPANMCPSSVRACPPRLAAVQVIRHAARGRCLLCAPLLSSDPGGAPAPARAARIT